MNTIILDSTKELEKSLEIAIDFLKNGEIIGFPTETVYGLGAPIFLENSIEKVFSTKKRPKKNPLSAHISSIEDVEMLVDNIPDVFYKIVENFLPGPVSVVMERKPEVPSIMTGGLETLSIRMPSNEVCLELIRRLGQPLAGTSANLSGSPSPTEVAHVLNDFDGKIPAIIDAGKCKYKIESTVVSLVEEKPTILRPGAISIMELREKTGVEFYSNEKQMILYDKKLQKTAYGTGLPTEVIENEIELMSRVKDLSKNSIILSLRELENLQTEAKIVKVQANEFFDILRNAKKEKIDMIIIYFDKAMQRNEFLKHRIENIKRSLPNK